MTSCLPRRRKVRECRRTKIRLTLIVSLAGNSKFDVASAKSATAAKKAAKAGSKAGAPTEGVQSLSLDEAPAPKSKKIDVLAEFGKGTSKRSASFVVVGKYGPGLCDQMNPR